MKTPFFEVKGSEIVILAVVAVGLYWLAKNEVKAGAAAVGNAINPLSQTNVFNRAVNATGAAVTGTKPGDWSLGSWVYDLTHDEYDPNAKVTPTMKPAGLK